MNVRFAKPEDAADLLKWALGRVEVNKFDPDVLLYPTTDVLAASNGQGVVAYVPVQLVAVIDSLALNPEAGAREKVEAVLAALSAIIRGVRARGVREIYFIGTDERVNAAAERRGFERLPWPLYRAKLEVPDADSK